MAPRGRSEALQGGGVELAAVAMRSFPTDPAAQRQACEALAELAAGCDGEERIGRAGAAAALLATMRTHSGAADVVESACRALALLTRADEFRAAFASGGGAALLVAALCVHSDAAEVALPHVFPHGIPLPHTPHQE